MTEAIQKESRESLAGETLGQILGNTERLENSMSVARIEVGAASKPISHNHAVALALAEHVPVFLADPVPKPDDPDSPRKTPLVPRGVSWKAVASQDAEKLQREFNKYPNALVALPCGPAGVLVIDPDRKNGIDGVAHFNALVAEHGLPEGVVIVETVSGGRHYYFKQLEGEPLGNSERGLSGLGINVRGVGGYVIAGGTDWRERGWREAEGSPKLLDALRDGTLPEPPEWLVGLLQARKKPDLLPKQGQEAFVYERPSHGDCGAVGERERAYATAALDGECARVAGAPEGARNNVLNEAAFSLGTAVGAGWLSRGEAEAELANAANACGLPRDEAARTIQSGLSAGELKPRGPIKDEAAPGYSFNLSALSDDTKHQSVTNGAPEPNTGLKFYFDGEDATTPPPSLVKGLLPFQGIAMIGGQSGSGKTFVAVNLAVALASGKPFFGRKIAERVGVVIVAAEGAATIASRVHAAREEAGLCGELQPISWIKSILDLRQRVEVARLAGALNAVGARMQREYGVRLGAVIIDTLGAAFSMTDENSNAEANEILRSLHNLSEQTGALILPVHHYGKSAETGLRGASAWRGGCDAVLSVLAERNEITGNVSNRRLALAKSRVGEEGEISGFALQAYQLGLDSDGEEVTTCTVLPMEGGAGSEKSKRQSRGEVAYLKALSVVTDKAEKVRPFEGDCLEVSAVDRETIRAEFYPSWPADGTAEQKSDTRRKAFNRAEQALRDRRKINVREIGGRQMVWPLEEDAIQKSGTPGQ